MYRDIRDTPLYCEAAQLFSNLRAPGTGQISDSAEVHVSADGASAVFAGAFLDKLEGAPQTRICHADLQTGHIRILTFGPNTDHLPKFSPEGRQVAFLSDRHASGDFQLYLLDSHNGAARPTPHVDGWVEYLQWSPDGKRILLGVAGHGADISGGEGAVTSKQMAAPLPSWMPTVETGNEEFRWRSAWVYELATNCVFRVDAPRFNVWEAAWCGNEQLAAIVSPGPGEGLWYSAHLRIIEVSSGESREVYSPQDQLGWVSGSPGGGHVAIVEALCSDRWIVAGDLRVLTTRSGEVKRVNTLGVDIAYTEWRSDQQLLAAGHRGPETVIGLYDVQSGNFREVWSSSGSDLSTGGRYVRVSGFGPAGDCVLLGEGFVRAPELAVIRDGQYSSVKSFDLGETEYSRAVESVESINWAAPDGIPIEGWLLRPRGKGPLPVVMYIHGGPVWQWRPTWLGRGGSALMLLKRGYAIFLPNPRGSSGRGQAFARKVLGDMGGADTRDFLSGLDYLVEQGIADPKRLGVTGGSYGGFMTSWLITQDSRFRAAVPFVPHTNQVTEHLLSNIPHFMRLFLADEYNNPGGKYFSRSPVMFAGNVTTPTLNLCGALDRVTPAEEAVQFHNALLEHGVKSVLVTYPEEGHGVRCFPALIDFTARVVGWFEEHMGK